MAFSPYLHFGNVSWKGSAAWRPGDRCERICCQLIRPVPSWPPQLAQPPSLPARRSACLPLAQTWKSSSPENPGASGI